VKTSRVATAEAVLELMRGLKAGAQDPSEWSSLGRAESGWTPTTSMNSSSVVSPRKPYFAKTHLHGEFEYGGEVYQGSHEPLVSRAVWERCQEILDGRHKNKHRKTKHDFTFSGFIRCGLCGCSLVGEIEKGRYVYYHCTGYRGKCHERYAREEHLTNCFAQRLRELVIAREIIEWLRDELVHIDLTEQAAREQALRRYQADLDRLQKRLDTLYEDRLDGRIDADRYDRKAAEIHEDQQRIRTKVSECRGALPSAKEALKLISLTSKAAELFLEQSGSEQRKLLRLVMGNSVWQAGELRMSFQPPFDQLQLSNSASARNDKPSGPSGVFLDIWRRGRDSLCGGCWKEAFSAIYNLLNCRQFAACRTGFLARVRIIVTAAHTRQCSNRYRMEATCEGCRGFWLRSA
jgi:hypothetical protein